jgi:predicted transport protein
MGMIEDHIAYAEPHVRPILDQLRARIPTLDRRVKEGSTLEQRFTYAINRQFAEVKVQKKCVLVRFFQSRTPDPQKLVQHIGHANKNRWVHDKEMRLYDIQTVDYLMPFLEASLRESMRA